MINSIDRNRQYHFKERFLEFRWKKKERPCARVKTILNIQLLVSQLKLSSAFFQIKTEIFVSSKTQLSWDNRHFLEIGRFFLLCHSSNAVYPVHIFISLYLTSFTKVICSFVWQKVLLTNCFVKFYILIWHQAVFYQLPGKICTELGALAIG